MLALLRHDPGVLEVVPPTDLHGEILSGRFMARIFITASDPAVLKRTLRRAELGSALARRRRPPTVRHLRARGIP